MMEIAMVRGNLTFWFLAIWIGGLVAGGVLDYFLDRMGLPTISDTVWKYPLLGIPIVLWAAAGAVYLTLHFFFNLDRPLFGM
jgi:hypothetical protein